MTNCFIYGNNTFLSQDKLKTILQDNDNFGFDVQKFVLSEIDSIKNINLVRDLFSTPKLYLFEDITYLKENEQIQLLEYIELELLKNPELKIIFFERENLRADSKLLKHFKKLNFEIHKFEIEKNDYQKDTTAIKFVYEELKNEGMNFEPNIPRLIVNQVGSDLGTLDNELEKLKILNQVTITPQIIQRYLISNIDISSFSLLDKLFLPNQNIKNEVNYVIQDMKSYSMFVGLLAKKLSTMILNNAKDNIKIAFQYLLDLDYIMKTGKLDDERTAICLFYIKLHE